ncbi:relaxase domain-containing protein [Gluconobacter albidus]|uniref:MobF family relaxase n=1 Tax=Gluconobacter albidus TaxID=318683 RepID=UPI00209F80CB|nr:MobF family relaxase [Gluconobacter albidus]MCP1274440.1 relaxase domain-containing protein [Gluconobacter albidus]
MMTFRKISAACRGSIVAAYFTEGAPDPEHDFRKDGGKVPDGDGKRLTSYYTGRDSRASWRPDMSPHVAQALGVDLRSPPRHQDLSRLYEGKRADNGEVWSKSERKISAYDLTLAPHKSISLAAELAPTEAERAAIWHAIDQANDDTMRYVARELGYARRGHGGEGGAEKGDVAWVSYRHTTARPTVEARDPESGLTYLIDSRSGGDPHDHIHNTFFNVVVTEDGHVGSLDTKRLRSRVHEFGAFFQARLADRLRKIGVAQGYDANEQATVALGVSKDLCDFFSKGRRQVVQAAKDYAAKEGHDWETMPIEKKQRILSMAGLASRHGKERHEDEVESWKRQARELGWEEGSLLGSPLEEIADPKDRHEQAYAFAARHLGKEFETAAVLDHDKLRMYAARGLIGAGIPGGIEDIDQVVKLIEDKGLEVRGEQVSLVSCVKNDRVRVTNTAQIRVEETLAKEAVRASADRSASLSDAQLTEAIERCDLDFDNEHGQSQKAAIYALGKAGKISMLTGVAGSGKTTLLQPLVDAWKRDTRFSEKGREMIGLATAWRQADALGDAGIHQRYAMMPFLSRLEKGEQTVDENTVLVIDEVGQIAPRQMLQLLELQRASGCTIKALGDREQAQSIEAGDTVEILRRVLAKEDMPELLSTVRQTTARNREIAGLFRGETPDADALDALRPKGKAAYANRDQENAEDPRNAFHFEEVRRAIDMKREDGTIRLVGGDQDEVLQKIAELYVTRRDALAASGSKRGISMSALTNQDAADLSRAVRRILQERGEISRDEVKLDAVDQRGETYELQVAAGDKLRLFRRTWGAVDGKGTTVGNNGDVVEVVSHGKDGLKVRMKDGREADVEWRRLKDHKTGRILLGFGHAMTIDAAQGLTSDEHINALPRGVATATGFTSYVAESRAKGTTWTMISDGATFEAVRNGRALGDTTEITSDDLWNHVAKGMSNKPYKALGMDLPFTSQEEREKHVQELIRLGKMQEEMAQDGRDYGREVANRVQAITVAKMAAPRLKVIDEQIEALLAQRGAAPSEAEQTLRKNRIALAQSVTTQFSVGGI